MRLPAFVLMTAALSLQTSIMWAGVTMKEGTVSFGVDLGCSRVQGEPPDSFTINGFFSGAINLRDRPSGSTDNWHGWGQVSWSIAMGTSGRIKASSSTKEGANGVTCRLDGGGTGWNYARGHADFALSFTTDRAFEFTSSIVGNVSGISNGNGVLPAGTHTLTANSRGNTGEFAVDVLLSPLPCGLLNLSAEPQILVANNEDSAILTATLGPNIGCNEKLIVISAEPSQGISIHPQLGALTDADGTARFRALSGRAGTIRFNVAVAEQPAVTNSIDVTFQCVPARVRSPFMVPTCHVSTNTRLTAKEDSDGNAVEIWCYDNGFALNGEEYIDDYHMVFYRNDGKEIPVGKCLWIDGRNIVWYEYAPGPDNTIQCLTKLYMLSYDPPNIGKNDCNNDPEYYHMFQYIYEPPSDKPMVTHWRSKDGPGGVEPDLAVDSLEDQCATGADGEGGGAIENDIPPYNVPPRLGGPMSAVTYEKCDIDLDGDCDPHDRQLFEGVMGICVTDATFNLMADADGDGCITLMDAEFLFGSGVDFVRGDSNVDGDYDVSDPIYTVLYLFGPAERELGNSSGAIYARVPDAYEALQYEA